MKMRLFSVLAFALAVSAGTAFVLYKLIASKITVGASVKPKTIKVAVASRDLQPGSMIQEADIGSQEYLVAPSGAIFKKEEIVGRGVTNPIHKDSPFYDGFLAPKGGGAGFSATIPQGMRAFAVHVNDVVGVAGFAVTGMHVDVLVSGPPPLQAPGTTGDVTRTLLQNIQVLSAGQNYQKDAEGKPVMVQVVNLLVTPSQAELLNLATDHRVQLVLRNPIDKEIVQTPGATAFNLFEGVNGGAPAPPARPRVVARQRGPEASPRPAPTPKPETITIEVFHGAAKAEATFPSADPQSMENKQ